jgi:purine-nucleoside phosphorylase
MRLLVFAHRGEAQTFLKELEVKSHPQMNELYIGDNLAILLCGEGHIQSLSKLSYTLGKLPDCNEVINLGICGALNPDIPLNSIHEIRTIYAQGEFKSFSNESNKADIDIITSKDRALKPDQAKELAVFADLVDREAWSLAHISKDLGIDFRAIKMVSDHITDAEVCQLIKEKAEVYSDILFDHYKSLESSTMSEEEQCLVFSNPNFYFTVSQKRQYANLLRAIIQKEDISESEIDLSNIESLDKTPKQRAKLLCDHLNKRLYPFKTKVQEHLDEITNDLRKFGAEFKFDKSLEKTSFQFLVRIDSEKSQIHMSETLKKFPWQRFEKIMKGEFDV